jgi:hypothetical protein
LLPPVIGAPNFAVNSFSMFHGSFHLPEMRYKDDLVAEKDSPSADPARPAELPRLQALGWLFIKTYEALLRHSRPAKIWHKPAL